jgi:hypothetical protein
MTIKFPIFQNEELMMAKFLGHISDGKSDVNNFFENIKTV